MTIACVCMCICVNHECVYIHALLLLLVCIVYGVFDVDESVKRDTWNCRTTSSNKKTIHKQIHIDTKRSSYITLLLLLYTCVCVLHKCYYLPKHHIQCIYQFWSCNCVECMHIIRIHISERSGRHLWMKPIRFVHV